jgi:hypothetical protein
VPGHNVQALAMDPVKMGVFAIFAVQSIAKIAKIPISMKGFIFLKAGKSLHSSA